jgi:hypothetical protein
VIHDTFARVAPAFTGANEAGLAAAIELPDYFKFCLVRNPYQRAFSAWQSKWFIQKPLQSGIHAKGVSEFVAIETVDDLKAMFESFLLQLSSAKEPDLHDVHVAPQAALLEPELLQYDIVANIEDPAPLVQALAGRVGLAFGNPFAGKRTNMSLLSYSSTWISDSAARLIREISARDFAALGYDLVVPESSVEPSSTEIGLALRAIRLLYCRNRRIGELGAELTAAAPQVTKAVQTLGGVKNAPSSVQVYVSEVFDGIARSYSEERCGMVVYRVDGTRRAVVIQLPEDLNPITKLRLDIANTPSVIALHGLTLAVADGTELCNFGDSLLNKKLHHLLSMAPLPWKNWGQTTFIPSCGIKF